VGKVSKSVLSEMHTLAMAAGHPLANWQIDVAKRNMAAGMVNPVDLLASVTRVLIDGRTGNPIKVGDVLPDFRGDLWTVTGWPHDGRNRIWVKAAGESSHTAEFFPSVFELVWRD
jgi:hypothetical protein